MLWLHRRQLGRFLDLGRFPSMCTARRSWCFAQPVFYPVLWRSSGGVQVLCVYAFERRRVEFSTSLETGLNCHGIRFRRSLSTNLFLCVWEGRQMDGGVGSSDLNCADLAISSLLYLTCFSRLAIAIWKDDGRVKPEEALVVEVQGGACR